MAVLEAARSFRRRLTAYLDRRIDRRWDHRHCVDTCGVEQLRDLDISDGSAEGGFEYAPSPVRMIRYALRCLPRTAGITFVDLGSGKGRVLFVAAELPFRRLIGVEFARQLHDAALRNLASYRNPKQACFDITPVLGDASKFPIPEDSCLIYLYTPFKGPLLREVLAGIASSYARNPRPMYLVYGYQIDYHRRLFDAVPGFARMSPGGRARFGLAPRRTDVHVYGTREAFDL